MPGKRRPLAERLYNLRVEGYHPAPRKVPRKLKKEWQRAVRSRMPTYRDSGSKRRIRLHRVPYQGWTLTIIHRAYVVARLGIVRVDLKN